MTKDKKELFNEASKAARLGRHEPPDYGEQSIINYYPTLNDHEQNCIPIKYFYTHKRFFKPLHSTELSSNTMCSRELSLTVSIYNRIP